VHRQHRDDFISLGKLLAVLEHVQRHQIVIAGKTDNASIVVVVVVVRDR